MQKLTSLRFGSLVSASPVKLGAILIFLAGLTVIGARAQDSFAGAQDLGSADWLVRGLKAPARSSLTPASAT